MKFCKQLIRGILTFITVYVIFTLSFAFSVTGDKDCRFSDDPAAVLFPFWWSDCSCTLILLDVGGHLLSDLTDKKWGCLKIRTFPLESKNNI